jgi:WD40 repeat protein
VPDLGGGALIPGEAYDPLLKELFVSNPSVNRVEVYSTVDGHHIGEISIPGPAGLSFSPDYAKLVIGTITPYVYFADPTAMHVIGQIEVPSSFLRLDQFSITEMPVFPFAMSDGTILLGMGSTPESASNSSLFTTHLVLYNPVGGTFSPHDPGPGGMDAVPSRTLDGKYLLVEGLNNSNLEVFLYSTAAQGYIAISNQVQNGVVDAINLAANLDGSQFASVEQIPGAGSFSSLVTFYNSTLQAGNQFTISGSATSALFSRDGKYLYLQSGPTTLVVLNTQTGQPFGYLGISPPPQQLFDIDENNHLFGASVGVMMINASQPQMSPTPFLPSFNTGLPSTEANPNVGPLTGGNQVQFAPTATGPPGGGGDVSTTAEAYFGATPATNDVVAPNPSGTAHDNFLTATAPPATNPGPVSVLLTDASNNAIFALDAYTYGPHILRVDPNVALGQGPTEFITIYAYGLGFFDTSDIHVTIGGMPMGISSLDSYASFTFPEQSVTVQILPGTPGWADITLTTPNGSDTLKRGFQYLSKKTTLQVGPSSFAIHDSVRDKFYVTGNGNTVAIFDPGTQAFVQPLQSQAVSSSAILAGEALTPDSSKLIVADPMDQTVVIFDLVGGTSSAVKVILPSDQPTILTAPMSIVASANNRAFVSLTPCILNPVREINLTNLTVTLRPDAVGACPANAPYPQSGAATGDGSTIFFAGVDGSSPPTGVSIWRYDAATDTFNGPFLIGDAPWVSGAEVAFTDADGGVIGVGRGVLDQNLLPLVPVTKGALSSALNETGSLLYGIDSNGGFSSATYVSDTRNGRPLLSLGLPSSSFGAFRPLAIDPTGKKILYVTGTSITYFELAVVPLAVGTVSPALASAGAAITIRGSGFVAGTTVQIGGKNATCSETDSETLSCTIPNLSAGAVSITLANPDGQTYSFENALVVH